MTSDTSFRGFNILYKTIEVNGLDIFYREAGPKDAMSILLLHGFPTSSHMFRNLIPALSDKFHLVAPDYPGFGNSSMPKIDEFDYTFDNIAEIIDTFTQRIGLKSYAMYVMDYGAPVGYRIAVKHPERVQALIVQNGNAYEEGLREFWKPIKAYWEEKTTENADALRNSLLTIEATKWQYTNGVRNSEAIAPIIGSTTSFCWSVPATRISSCSCSMIMARIHRFTLIGKPISESINHPH